MVIFKNFFASLVISSIFLNVSSAQDKAIVASSRDKGIQLSDIAKKNINFKTMILQGNSPFRIPVSSLVQSRDLTGLYIINEQWIKFIQVKLVRTDGESAFVEGQELKAQSEIVTGGVALVRVSEMEAFSTEE